MNYVTQGSQQMAQSMNVYNSAYPLLIRERMALMNDVN